MPEDPSAGLSDPARLHFRVARANDLERVVEIIADDALSSTRPGANRELTTALLAAFASIEADPNNELIVATLHDEVVATMQLTYLFSISRGGARRLLIEAVFVDASHRGRGIGRTLMQWAHQRGRDNGCSLAQLTSDKVRTDAHRFYRSLGYAQSHEGFKIQL